MRSPNRDNTERGRPMSMRVSRMFFIEDLAGDDSQVKY